MNGRLAGLEQDTSDIEAMMSSEDVMNCANCGHPRHLHRRAARLSGWERGRGQTRPRPGAWLPCRAIDLVPHEYEVKDIVLAGVERRATISGKRMEPCKCRKFKEVP